MGETFYSVLGVGDDADRETIRQAYRSHVKEIHPDVSDSPDAGQRFKQITTARDVLLDEDERGRYDQLGPWFVVHVVLVSSALTTGWFGYTASANVQSATTVLFGLVLVLLVISLSLLYVLVRLSS